MFNFFKRHYFGIIVFSVVVSCLCVLTICGSMKSSMENNYNDSTYGKYMNSLKEAGIDWEKYKYSGEFRPEDLKKVQQIMEYGAVYSSEYVEYLKEKYEKDVEEGLIVCEFDEYVKEDLEHTLSACINKYIFDGNTYSFKVWMWDLIPVKASEYTLNAPYWSVVEDRNKRPTWEDISAHSNQDEPIVVVTLAPTPAPHF